MLSKERAKRLLADATVADARERLWQRIRALPSDIQRVARSLLGTYRYEADTQPTVAKEALNLPIAQRRLIWQALMPRLAGHVETVLGHIERGPYRRDAYCRAFRAPRSPELTSDLKLAWIAAMAYIDEPYCQTPEWYAQSAPYVNDWQNAIGTMLAAIVDAGGHVGQTVYETLIASALGEHEIGGMGVHVVEGLLGASIPEGWTTIERLLLAAQRQEGLRQRIIENADLMHPVAFMRILRLVLDEGLARFSSVVRAADVWFGARWTAPQVREVNSAIQTALRFLQDEAETRAAIASGTPDCVYLGLWSLAYSDIAEAIRAAKPVLSDANPDRRAASAWALAQIGVNFSAEAALPALDDPDMRVAWPAFCAVIGAPWQSPADSADEVASSRGLLGMVIRALRYGQPKPRQVNTADVFDALVRLADRLPPQRSAIGPVVFPWLELKLDRSLVAAEAARYVPKEQPMRLLPLAPMMDSGAKREAIKDLARHIGLAPVRAALVKMVADASPDVRDAALEAISTLSLTDEETVFLESLLARKSADLRRQIIARLLKQSNEAAQASADRLAASTNALQRNAADEILKELVKRGRAVPSLEHQPAEEWSEENGFGLYDPASRTRPASPRVVDGVELTTEAAVRALLALDELVWRNREMPVGGTTEFGSRAETLLGAGDFCFGTPSEKVPFAEDVKRLPLADIWLGWWRDRPSELRDPDGFELLRMMALVVHEHSRSGPQVIEAAGQRHQLRYAWIVDHIMQWLLVGCPPSGAVPFILDALETSLALVPPGTVHGTRKGATEEEADWRETGKHSGWIRVFLQHVQLRGAEWTPESWTRAWPLLRYIDEPAPTHEASTRRSASNQMPRFRPRWELVVRAYAMGVATRADVIEHLIGISDQTHWFGTRRDLWDVTRRSSRARLDQAPGLAAIVDEVRDRIVDIESRRGELPTQVSNAAARLADSGGARTVIQVLVAQGRTGFVRSGSAYPWCGAQSRPASFMHLIGVAHPRSDDTPESFARAVCDAGVLPSRLIEASLIAPQWADHIEAAVGWPGLADGVWWLHAHTRDPNWSSWYGDTREEWTGRISRRTPVAAQDLLDGAVDVEWFRLAYDRLGEKRWEALQKAARFTCAGAGHKRAQMFADAMRGRLTREQLVQMIRDKRNQDAVRALGLVPLAEGAERNNDVLERYLILQEFRRESRQYGSMRQASERLAADIAMQNLARTAGYPDPSRLEWAMERAALEDLRDGSIEAVAGDVTVRLAIDPWGRPSLRAMRGSRLLSAIPASARKDPSVAALVMRERDVRKQSSRVRRSLEEAMCRKDRFAGAELRDLMEHPVLAPMLRSLVFVGTGMAGYPVDGGRALESADGTVVALPDAAEVRIAHPTDLLDTGEWHVWQRECFMRERIQPFKQVFRELYVPTRAECEDQTQSLRYAGHQVNPRQALSLLGQRGWVNDPEDGPSRTFHREGIVARLVFDEPFWSPAQVEAPTIEAVTFSDRSAYKPLPLAGIPPILFSEVMRDVDLVVSVAHVGGVDPEASASTVAMRGSVVRETCRLLQLDNVRIEGNFARIDGVLTQYSVHLGSGVVHQSSGAVILIVPVHSQHRGRLFLPFMDDDPRTAAILSMVLLLAKDQDIREPGIIEQIMRSR